MAKFQKGNPGKQKGTISEKTKFWNQLKDFMTNEGAEKYQKELMNLKGKEFIVAYSSLLEYFQPKLIRSEVKTENQSAPAIVINKIVTPDVRNTIQNNTTTE